MGGAVLFWVCLCVVYCLGFGGGGCWGGWGFFVWGYSEKVPTATGKPRSYLEPNSQTLQERGRGVGQAAEGKGTRTYLMPNRNSMQKPIGGRSKNLFAASKKEKCVDDG